MFFFLGTTLYGLAYFLPSIVNQLGFSPNKTQLLSAGPFAAGFLITLPAAYLSDRFSTRVIPICVISSLSVAGFALFLRAPTKGAAYGSLYLSVPGIYASAPLIMAWMANNSEPYYQRATSTALSFVATNSGGILSTWRFPTKEGPKFVHTTIMDLVFSVLIIVGAIINAYYLNNLNDRKQRNKVQILAPYADDNDDGARAWLELGDKHPDFKYTL
ncbi:hypothetical protein HGRIS_011621 [Hohenbuehelia grisea]|uniref:Uncharacterized protein n=1 Tax=Hohenbuehelia grisea TaxID=104357 RepID=A0ABR3JXU9_9AGAR